MKLEVVPVSQVDFQDETLSIGSKADLSSLKNSVKEVGVINPPLLIERKGKYQIVCGRRRLEVCRELGIGEVLSRVYLENEISPEECLKLVFHENRERLGDMEKAELILKFQELCGFDENALMQKALPFLGIPSSRKNLEKYMSLARLEKEIKGPFYSQEINLEQALALNEADSSSRVEILERVILRFKLNTNETREFVREVQEVGFREGKSVSEVIDENESRIGTRATKADIRRELKLMRYPRLTQVEEEFKRCVKDLGLPKEVNIFHPSFFEGNYIEMRMRIESSMKLREILSSLGSAIDKGEIDRLINIIKEGG